MSVAGIDSYLMRPRKLLRLSSATGRPAQCSGESGLQGTIAFLRILEHVWQVGCGLCELLGLDPSVNGGGRQVFMAEDGADFVQTAPVFDKSRGVTVPELVRANPLRVNPKRPFRVTPSQIQERMSCIWEAGPHFSLQLQAAQDSVHFIERHLGFNMKQCRVCLRRQFLLIQLCCCPHHYKKH